MVNKGKKIEKVLKEEMELLGVDLNENEVCQLTEVLSQLKHNLKEQKINDIEEITIVIENYIKSIVSFIDEEDDLSSCEEIKNSRYDTPYAALVMRKSSSLGVARAIKLMLKILNIDSRIAAFHNYERDYTSYLVYVDASDEDYEDDEGELFYPVDPYNSLFCDMNFLMLDTLYEQGEFLDVENEV